MIRSLYGLTGKQIAETLSLKQKFRGEQIYRWLVQGVTSFDKMSNLPKSERVRLKGICTPISSAPIKESRDENAVKLAIELEDKRVVECVMLSDARGRKTACISSQVGCAMGCAFCRTGTMGLIRNLEVYEIIEQFFHLSKLGDITHIVFMGMGEPMANYKNVIKAIGYFHDPDGLNLSLRRITISTCGVIKGIDALSDNKLPVRLAVSLVSADPSLRNHIMPVNRANPLDKLKESLIRYQNSGGKRFTFEYCMLKGLNTDERAADLLAGYIKNLDVICNLIPYNEAAELPWERPDNKEIENFCSMLEKRRIKYTIRISKGDGISGACGQLAVKTGRNTR